MQAERIVTTGQYRVKAAYQNLRGKTSVLGLRSHNF
jgi:hypothetical protein